MKEKMIHKKIKKRGFIRKMTEMALLIQFKDDKEIWVPKTAIECEYNEYKKGEQDFLIDEWIVKRYDLL